jgi:mono/diheme cytochrome c family protein
MNLLEGKIAADGAAVLLEKGCTNCHSFDNWGGMFGPDLGSNRIRGNTPATLAAAMWNQAPAMWREIGPDAVPAMNREEAAGVFAFFYSRLYFDDVAYSTPRGESLFRSRCSDCHDLNTVAGSTKVGPPVESWGTIKDPIALVARMWNHSVDMLDQTNRQVQSWPRLSGSDSRALVSYLWQVPELVPVKAAFRFGDDAQGRRVFIDRCRSCHTLGPREPGKVDLTRQLRQTTMLQLAASMWNHAPAMKRSSPGVPLPALSEDETRNLVTYLVVGRSFEESGNALLGERVYRSKNCATCHENAPGAPGAPAIGTLQGPFNPVRMVSVLWSHGPKMLETMRSENMKWPTFKAQEMLDLTAYLTQKAAK